MTTTNDTRVLEAIPRAAALVCAVADDDPQAVEVALAGVTDWPALAVLLAANVDQDTPLRETVPISPEGRARLILVAAAARFGVTVETIRGDDRHRPVLDARATAIAAMRYAGLSSPFIGRQVCRDHTTVLAAASRVGEDARLRPIALELTHVVGREPLADADGAAA